jgi:hypothetical protein
VRHLGYLTPDEMGYVLTRSGFGEVATLESPAARRALVIGRSRARAELTCPPLGGAPWWAWVMYRLRRWWAEVWRHARELNEHDCYRLQIGKVLFRCTQCCQALRVPTRMNITATCPRCRTELRCET